MWKYSSRFKQLSRMLLHEARATGVVVSSEACEDCGAVGVQLDGHHENYAEPLSVAWLCGACHVARHNGHFRNPPAGPYGGDHFYMNSEGQVWLAQTAPSAAILQVAMMCACCMTDNNWFPLRQREVAQRTGLSVASVSRAMRWLRDNGVVMEMQGRDRVNPYLYWRGLFNDWEMVAIEWEEGGGPVLPDPGESEDGV